jgi:phospho-N-acetylmuramoyl-pentapeptide-transferase
LAAITLVTLKKGIFETKIVLRFWIISLLLAAITLVTLKIR